MTGQSKGKPPKTPFASRLREAQARSGLSNRELAGQMDVSESQLGKWKRGDITPNFENAMRLARVLDVPAEFFDVPEEIAA